MEVRPIDANELYRIEKLLDNGTGIVPGGFYFSVNGYCSSTNATEMCRQCNGSGVIWGVEDYDHEGLVSNTFEEVLKDG